MTGFRPSSTNTIKEISITQSSPGFPGFTHIAVTVSDLARSTAWYADLFGSAPVLDEDVEAGAFHHTVFAIGGGNLFGLHVHAEPSSAPFDERGPGLDHVSFACGDRAELEKWGVRLDSSGSCTARSSTLPTGPDSRSATRTASPWSSLLHPPDPGAPASRGERGRTVSRSPGCP